MPGWDTRSRRASEPALTADELHLLRWGLGGALALCSAWGVYFFDLGGAALLPPITLLVLAVLVWPDLPGRVPAGAWRLLFPGLILFVATDLVINSEPLAALVRLNLLLVTVRAIGHRRPREDLQLAVLCLFLVVAAGVLTVAMGFVLHLLLFTALALTYLLTITLSAATDPETNDTASWRRIPWGRLFERLRRAVDWRIVAAAGGLYLLVVALATLLFLALPRFQIENSLGFLQLKNRRSLSGFSETVRLGDVTDIAMDRTTALRAELDDPAQVPALPYWRMVALDEYRDGTFRTSKGLQQHERRIATTRQVAGRRSAGGPEPVWTFYYEAGVSRFLPITGEFARLRLREARALVANDRAGTLALREEPQAMFAFRIEGLDLGGGLADPGLAAAVRRAGGAAVDAGAYPGTLLAVPAGEGNAAVLDAIVAEITGGGTFAAAEFAERAVDWLERRHRYSMRSIVPAGGEDVLVRWLRSAEPGHCELFAGGFALLARQAGFPVRIVTGFKGGAWNAFEQYYMVRNSDAHAWCELYDEQGRWLRVDPTPGASGEAAAAAAGAAGRVTEVDRSWAARLDALRMLWYRRIVNFDRSAQDEMADSLKEKARQSGQALITTLDRWGRQLSAWLRGPWSFGRVVRAGGAVVLVVAAAWSVWHWRHLWWNRWIRRGRGDPVRREAGRWLRRLARVRDDARARVALRQLERLRYGPVQGRPAPGPVFRAARRAWRVLR